MNSMLTQDLAQAMKTGMRRLASGVSIIASRGSDGRKCAMTASSVTSLSDTPASLLVCIHKDARINSVIAESNFFSVNVLHESQQQISQVCASSEDSDKRFSVGDWHTAPESGLPYLADAESVFICSLSAKHVYGTHNIYIGDICGVQVTDREAAPLLYLDGGYCGVKKSV
ncbi:flavin reductase family protein [Teredinibacter sp. KSP-S5-2]|uniref:flavin reductase family protein n=1 Tax=Teredinibacter sp. KSP-S5-2 TaxID=3034506 RepID=UPI00293518EC|nr:flavin reductase family protein [Teredinibacter sp. KSP-S5-2]WNO11064.1 flavin reductase family protein [Teredinibacter sp. KSP-S5-2]